MAAIGREFFSKHNVVVSLDTAARGAEPYRQVLEFLQRSRIRYALTQSPPIMIDYVRQFWTTATFDNEVVPPVIRARMNNTDLVFSKADIAVAL